MYDIAKLEEEWKRYDQKRKRPLYYTLTSIVVLGVIIGMLFKSDYANQFFIQSLKDLNGSNRVESKIMADQNSSAHIAVNTPTYNATEPIKEEQKQKIESRGVYAQIDRDIKPYDTADVEPVLEEVETLPKPAVYHPPVPKYSDEIEVDRPKVKLHFEITDASSVVANNAIEKRFYETHDTDDSLFLAKKYFEKGNYKKAEYWALQTNKINENIDEAWIIFIQSKIKTGNINEAKKILKSYIEKSNSSNAIQLLDTLK